MSNPVTPDKEPSSGSPLFGETPSLATLNAIRANTIHAQGWFGRPSLHDVTATIFGPSLYLKAIEKPRPSPTVANTFDRIPA